MDGMRIGTIRGAMFNYRLLRVYENEPWKAIVKAIVVFFGRPVHAYPKYVL